MPNNDPSTARLASTRTRALALLTALAALLASQSAVAAYARVNEPNPDDLMNVHIYRLSNDLMVYLTENKETPRFYAEISVRAGSKHDPHNATGLAHYLEHLLFKGNREMGTLDYESEKPYLDKITALYERHFAETDEDTRKEIYAEINRISQEAARFAIPNEIDKVYKAMGGGALNAHTWHEETVYKVSLPKNRLRQWAAIESSRFLNPVFRLFHTELETVYEEKNRSLDNKRRIIDNAVNDLLYKKHPYGQQPTIGTVDHLKNPSLKYIYNFFNTYYVPNNMAITISGNIDIEETIEIIDDAFSSWRPRILPRPGTWQEDPIDGVERTTVTYKGEEYALLAFRTAHNAHPDAETLKLIDMILDNSVAGLININLNQQQRVRQAGSYPTLLNDYGAQYLYGIPKEGQTLEEVEQLLLDQIEIIKQGEFEDWILPAIITDFKKEYKASLESNAARVGLMREAFLANTEWDHAVAEIKRMERITKDDVLRVANRYFSSNYIAGYRKDDQHQIPSIDKPRIDPVDIDPSRQSPFAKSILEMPYDELEPVFVDPENDYEIVHYDQGVTLYYAPNPLNDLFSFSAIIEFGSHENNKLALATRLLDKSGTGEFSSDDLKKEWYKLGSSFSISVGDNETVIRISGLDENFQPTLDLLLGLLYKPTVDAETLETLKEIVLVSRADEKKSPQAIARALTNYNRLGQDSSFLRRLPDKELMALTVQELQELTKGLLTYKHVLTYTGSLSLDHIKAVLAQHHPLPESLKEPPPYRFLKARTPDASQIYFFDKEMAQARVRIEFGNGDYDEAIMTPVQLYNNYFAGGMSGIVFQELREARALAYSAGALYHTGTRLHDENLMIGVIECQADKTPEALEAFVDIIDNLPESPDRFRETLAAIENRYRTSKIGFRGVIGAVRSWERLGLEDDPRKRRFEEIQSAEFDRLLNFHQQRIQDRPKLISIVGDKNHIDMEKLAETGEIIEVSLDQIFVN